MGENDEDRRQLKKRIQSYEETQREITKSYVTWKRRQGESGKIMG